MFSPEKAARFHLAHAGDAIWNANDARQAPELLESRLFANAADDDDDEEANFFRKVLRSLMRPSRGTRKGLPMAAEAKQSRGYQRQMFAI